MIRKAILGISLLLGASAQAQPKESDLAETTAAPSEAAKAALESKGAEAVAPIRAGASDALSPSPPVAAGIPEMPARPAMPPVPEVPPPTAMAKQAAAEATRQIERKKQEAVADVLSRTRVESQTFRFGVYPNSAGFMDARLHVRLHYLNTLGSGLYLDYTTARAFSANGTVSRADRLLREYRAEADFIKGIVLLLNRSKVAWSIEPGVNGKLIHQEIDESGFNTNAFNETVYRNTGLRVSQLTASAKLETTLVVANSLRFDLSGEYLPWIYQFEKGTTHTSQFADPVEFSLRNRTTGYQIQGDLAWDTGKAGEFSARGLVYQSKGDVSSRSSLVSGNFEYTFETFSEASRFDSWLEIVHTATYIRLFGQLVPAVALAFQRKRITTSEDKLNADTYKAGLLLEWR